MEVGRATPQELVQNRSFVRQTTEEIVEVVQVQKGPKRVFVDFLPPHSVWKPCTGKVFAVEMPHQHVHRVNPGDSVVFNIKGLDKHNMP